VETIEYLTASGAYVELHAGREQFIVRERLLQLEVRLDPAHFLRVHRSTIVRLDRIETLLRAGGGDYAVRLRGGTELKVSRGRVDELERRLGMTS
jgi:two-component system LytT family response regulator